MNKKLTVEMRVRFFTIHRHCLGLLSALHRCFDSPVRMERSSILTRARWLFMHRREREKAGTKKKKEKHTNAKLGVEENGTN